MDLEGISIIAQIATGLATLAVAIFLASQLRLQHGGEVLGDKPAIFVDLYSPTESP